MAGWSQRPSGRLCRRHRRTGPWPLGRSRRRPSSFRATGESRGAAERLVLLCHQALSGTRGAAITLGVINHAEATLEWLGVGNVAGSLVRASPAGPTVRSSVMLRGGVIGHQLSGVLRPEKTSIQPGDVVLFGTDGFDRVSTIVPISANQPEPSRRAFLPAARRASTTRSCSLCDIAGGRGDRGLRR